MHGQYLAFFRSFCCLLNLIWVILLLYNNNNNNNNNNYYYYYYYYYTLYIIIMHIYNIYIYIYIIYIHHTHTHTHTMRYVSNSLENTKIPQVYMLRFILPLILTFLGGFSPNLEYSKLPVEASHKILKWLRPKSSYHPWVMEVVSKWEEGGEGGHHVPHNNLLSWKPFLYFTNIQLNINWIVIVTIGWKITK